MKKMREKRERKDPNVVRKREGSTIISWLSNWFRDMWEWWIEIKEWQLVSR